ncbi:hypothetical protein K439DRAFT_1627368 [Ramaria rubella]|nr:hypothetical protein K439DRAFT_1627368 [Ramaria rubella]
MTQSQVVPNFPVTPWDGPVHAASPSDTEPDNDNDERPVKAPELPAPMLRPQMPAKSTFPSLSQLSFDKFRPSFLLTGRFSQSQKKDKEKEQEIIQPEDESDSEDDESSENDDRQSHIPKDKRAGVGVTKKRKPRGLLHI